MARHWAILGLAFVLLASSASRAADGPSKPKPTPGSLIVETGTKGQVKITSTKERCEPTRITVATLDDGSVRVEMNDKVVVTAESFKFVVRDGDMWEIALSGHVRMSFGQYRIIFADEMTFSSVDAPASIEVPKAKTSAR